MPRLVFKNRYLFSVLHIILWLGYTSLPVLNAIQSELTKSRVNAFLNPIYWAFVSISSIILFYLNSEYLFPNIYKKKQPIKYFLILLSIICLLTFLRYWVRITFVGNDDINLSLFYLNSFLQNFYVFGISASYCFFSDYQRQQELHHENERERLKSELSFLRSQISPHFMFNLLNSIVSLNRKKSDQVEPVLLKMSDLLRYMLYEKDDKQISLENEIKYLSNYIDLQKIRFGEYVYIEFVVKNTVADKKIEPMLLIPFVENAFKHGVGMIEKPYISVHLETTPEKLLFRVANKFSADNKEQKDSSSGIGLSNVNRRLELLYPDQYELYITEEDNQFVTELALNYK